jgi:hypothetical protein
MARKSQNEARKRIQEVLSSNAVELDLSTLAVTEIPELVAHLTDL